MRLSDRGFAEILSHEALVTRRYKDSVGVWTCGVGHTAAAGQPNPVSVTEDQPVDFWLDLFRRDLQKYEDDVERAVKVDLAQHEFDAAVSFHFNTGRIGSATWVKKLNAGDRAGAARGILAYNKPKEIIPRRTAEMKLFRDGIYSNDGYFTVYPASDKGAVQWSKGKRQKIGAAATAKPLAALDPVRDAERKAKAEDALRAIQADLKDLGYNVGGIDGKMGTFTRGAILAFRADRGLPPTPMFGPDLLPEIEKAKAGGWKRPISPERAEKPKEEIAKTSATLKTTWWAKMLTAVGLGGGAAGNTVKNLLEDPDRLESHASLFARFASWASDNFILILGLVVAGIGVYAALQIVEHLRVKAEREGRHFPG